WVKRFGIESGKGRNQGRNDPHRVGIPRKTFQNPFEIFVDERVQGYLPLKLLQFLSGGQLTVNDEVSDFQKSRVFGQLLYGVTPVAQNAFLPIQKGNGTGG